MEMLKLFLHDRQISYALSKRIKRYYGYYLHEGADFKIEEQILNELPPPIRTEILFFLNKHMIEKISFFLAHKKEHSFIVSICKMLKPVFAAPLDCIMKEGEEGYEMF